MYNNVKMGVWVANKLGALNPTFIKYRNTLESYETFSRIVEARAFLKQIRQILFGKNLHQSIGVHKHTIYRYK